MKAVILQRLETGDEGTRGILTAPGFECRTLELPWRENNSGSSCIPPGEYVCRWGFSPSRKQWTYRLEDPLGASCVPGRAGVLIHSGNFAGDIEKNLQSHVLGCILLGARFGRLENRHKAMQFAVLNSKSTCTRFADSMARLPFVLVIKGAEA